MCVRLQQSVLIPTIHVKVLKVNLRRIDYLKIKIIGVSYIALMNRNLYDKVVLQLKTYPVWIKIYWIIIEICIERIRINIF